ncbi:MAG: pyrimidine 5'-nucleotidase [Rhizobiales bacterium]|nr:pyrimidine 5'-nucleotidase [Hyphomicrobiales bacterium]MBO6700585.1 pyrimidine 5'-nucleotidase [Hyphomicrobiales bacterium]MBO6738121.1 pyrimidine 5'-nucleotidase [Hyphomicrobiales bacterium]MBO6913572.1 pyrimidine 5'-nucleotidase [Hyphomicrobiales bacterium]MBO6955259.1 pyrimidine 5'-nucleotidase [Hyphomicrobiales bacterium]
MVAAHEEHTDLEAFAQVEHWVFDLDNTLYPHHSNLFAQIDEKMTTYLSKLMELEKDEARVVQKTYYRTYGTTMRGLMVEQGITPDDFLDFVHDIDHSVLEPDPKLDAMIEGLPGHKYVFTNGTEKHARAVLDRLGVSTDFQHIFDIVSADLIPKPNGATYDKFLELTGIEPTKAAMFEDLSRNLKVPHERGMLTTLIVPRGTREVFHEDWELEGRDDNHVRYVTDHLADFLEDIRTTISR